MPGFPNDAKTFALWRLDDAKGNTTVVDTVDEEGNLNLSWTSRVFGAVKDQAEDVSKLTPKFLGTNSSDYLEAALTSGPIKTALDSGDFTIEAWVLLDTTQGGAAQRVILQSGTFAAYAISFEVNASNRLLGRINGESDLTGTTALTFGEWHHVAMVLNSSDNTLRLYLDGVQDAILNSANAHTHTIDSLEIGGTASGFRVWDGHISDVRVSDIARSQPTLAGIAAAPTTPPVSDANSVAIWRLGENYIPPTQNIFLDKTLNADAHQDTASERAAVIQGPNIGQLAFDFDGSNDFYGGTAKLSVTQALQASQDRTLEAIIRIPSSSGLRAVASWGGFVDAQSENVALSLLVNGTSVRGFWEHSGGVNVDVEFGTLSLNTWHHIAVTIADAGGGDEIGEVFIDGVSQGSLQDTAWDGGELGKWIIARGTASGIHFHGDIAEIRMSNKVRTPAEMLAAAAAMTMSQDANTISLLTISDDSLFLEETGLYPIQAGSIVPTITEGFISESDQALSFDPTVDDHLFRLGNDAALRTLCQAGDYTMQAWTSLEQNFGRVGIMGMSHGTGSASEPGNDQAQLQISDDGTMHMVWNTGVGSVVGHSTAAKVPLTKLFGPRLMLSAVVRSIDGTNSQVDFYYNDTFLETSPNITKPTGGTDSAVRFRMGHLGLNAGDYWGSIDEAMISNDVRTAQEIADMYDSGSVLGVVPDLIDPVVNYTVPSPGSTIAPNTPVTLEVTDNADALLVTFIWAVFPSSGQAEVIYDGDDFTPLYEALSTKTDIANGCSFAIRRSQGWPSSPEIKVKALDTSGNEAT